MSKLLNLKNGFSLLEIVIVLGLMAIVVSALVQTNLMFTRNISSGAFTVKANAVAAETMEALRFLKEVNWNNLNNLTPNSNYYLTFSEASSDKWNIVSSDPGKTDGVFTRSFLVKEVYRDAATGKIISSGGDLDNKILLAEVNVDWTERGKTKNIKLTTYLAEY